jgi:hypothetical protein
MRARGKQNWSGYRDGFERPLLLGIQNRDRSGQLRLREWAGLLEQA